MLARDCAGGACTTRRSWSMAREIGGLKARSTPVADMTRMIRPPATPHARCIQNRNARRAFIEVSGRASQVGPAANEVVINARELQADALCSHSAIELLDG